MCALLSCIGLYPRSHLCALFSPPSLCIPSGPRRSLSLSLPLSPSQRAGRAYATNRYRLAHELYSEAICVDLQDYHTNALLFANRAAALMNLGRNKDALKDCVEVSCGCRDAGGAGGCGWSSCC